VAYDWQGSFIHVSGPGAPGAALWMASCLLMGLGFSAFIDMTEERGWRRGPIYNVVQITFMLMMPLMLADIFGKILGAGTRVVGLLSIVGLALLAFPMFFHVVRERLGRRTDANPPDLTT
jgi:hypothetical protein